MTQSEDPFKVAVVVPSLCDGGGVPSVARFVCNVIEETDRFDSRVFSLPSSSRDPASVRLMAPGTWLRGPAVEEGVWRGRRYEHIGAVVAELEFQRYQSRDVLTRRLRECDLIQIVAGTPAWGLIAEEVELPVALQVATLASVERRKRFEEEGGLRTAWRRFMTGVTSRLDRRGAKVADQIFVENQSMEGTIRNWTDPENVVLAPPGVDTEFFHPPLKSESSERGYILSVGRFDDRRKNVQLLFRAYSRLCRDQDDPPQLVLAGKSSPRDEDWRSIDESGLRRRVRFHQNVKRAQLAELYRGASLFVLSSSEEGLGLVILEAMASGLPVVSTATHGAREAVAEGDTGILTPVGDAVALAQAMWQVLRDSELRRNMGLKGRARVENHYSRQAAGHRFLNGYRKLLGLDSIHSKEVESV